MSDPNADVQIYVVKALPVLPVIVAGAHLQSDSNHYVYIYEDSTLTALAHEIGHALGISGADHDIYENDELMSESHATGTTPT